MHDTFKIANGQCFQTVKKSSSYSFTLWRGETVSKLHYVVLSIDIPCTSATTATSRVKYSARSLSIQYFHNIVIISE